MPRTVQLPAGLLDREMARRGTNGVEVARESGLSATAIQRARQGLAIQPATLAAIDAALAGMEVLPAGPLAEAIERLLDERERQGLPRTVTDPGALAAIAGVLPNVKLPRKTKSSAAPTSAELQEVGNGGTNTEAAPRSE
jgi:hypothetical protein